MPDEATADIFTELGNRFGLATALRGMGGTAEPTDPDRARQLLHEALGSYATLKSPAVDGLRKQLAQLERRHPSDIRCRADADGRAWPARR